MRRQRPRQRSGRRWRKRRHGGCCCEGGGSVGLQLRIGAEHGVVISHEFGQQIFLKDVRPAVHIHLAAQLQQLTHLHFAEDWPHCSLFRRVALHRRRWVARSAAAAPGAARDRASATFPGLDWRLFAPSSGPLFLRTHFLHPGLELSVAIFACSKDSPDAGVLPPVTILARFNWCPVRVARNYSIVE